MKKKNVLIATALTLTMAIPFSVFAATSEAPAAKSVRKFFISKAEKITSLTDQQKADVKEYAQKKMDLQKEYINKKVANGSMTQEEADAALKKLEEAKGKIVEGGFGPRDFDKSKVLDKAKEFFKDSRGKGGPEVRGIDKIQLNEQQKADLQDAHNKMVALQKELIAKMAANGAISQEKANDLTKKMDEMAQKLQEKGIPAIMGMPMAGFGGFGDFGGFGLFRMHGIDESKLTEQQKADLTEYTNKMAELRKNTIAKMVANGALTQEQADAMNKKMEAMPKPDFDKRPEGRGMMNKGMFNKGMMERGR